MSISLRAKLCAKKPATKSEQCLGAGEQSEQVDDVVLGLVFDRELLARQRAVQRVPEVFLQVRNGLHPAG